MSICPKCNVDALCIGDGVDSYYEGCENCGYELVFSKRTIPDWYSCEKCGSRDGTVITRPTALLIRCNNCSNEIIGIEKKPDYTPRIKDNVRAKVSIPGPVSCPKCGSTQIATGARGYSIFWGFLGSGNTVNRCANCGNKWKPGK